MRQERKKKVGNGEKCTKGQKDKRKKEQKERKKIPSSPSSCWAFLYPPILSPTNTHMNAMFSFANNILLHPTGRAAHCVVRIIRALDTHARKTNQITPPPTCPACLDACLASHKRANSKVVVASQTHLEKSTLLIFVSWP